MNDSREEINFIARSSVRIRIFEELHDESRLTKESLKERLDASRTTVQRNLDKLKDRGWIEGNNREYWITHAGKPVTKQFLKLLNTIHAANRLQPFLKWIPQGELNIELTSLATADLVISEENNPYAPVNRHIELMQSANQFCCLLPAVGLQPLTIAHSCVIDHNYSHEIIFDPSIVETLQSGEGYEELIEDLLTSTQCEIYVSNREVPFYLGRAETTVQIGVGDEKETPQALVESDVQDVREWATERYEEYKATADPLRADWFDTPVSKVDSNAGSIDT
jgi:predicted transcriptional regulator